MIVCVCRAVCDRRLRGLAADGHQTLEAIMAACGAGGDCGTCQPQIEQIIEETSLIRPSRVGAQGASGDPVLTAQLATVRSAA